jgi:hypothetical protein
VFEVNHVFCPIGASKPLCGSERDPWNGVGNSEIVAIKNLSVIFASILEGFVQLLDRSFGWDALVW